MKTYPTKKSYEISLEIYFSVGKFFIVSQNVQELATSQLLLMK